MTPATSQPRNATPTFRPKASHASPEALAKLAGIIRLDHPAQLPSGKFLDETPPQEQRARRARD